MHVIVIKTITEIRFLLYVSSQTTSNSSPNVTVLQSTISQVLCARLSLLLVAAKMSSSAGVSTTTSTSSNSLSARGTLS